MSNQVSASLKLDWAFAGCGVAWEVLQTYIIHSFGFNWYIAVADGLVSTVLLAAACWLINNNLRYYQPGKGSYVNLFIWCVALAGFSMAGSRWFLPFVYSDPVYLKFLGQSVIIRLFTNFLAIGWMAMISLVWYAQLDHKENEKRKSEAERLARDAELYNLRQQLQPHFLFNSLNSINALIAIRPQEARQMVLKLSDFFRGSLKREDQQWVALPDELQYLELYLDIEKVRFGHRLSTDVSCDEAACKSMIPPMLLQPVVENAIKYGLYDTLDDITITIKGWRDQGMLYVEVTNPFDASLQQQPHRGTGFGLSSIRRRLYLLFARQDLLEIAANGNIFKTLIKVPQPYDKSDHH